MSPISKTRRDFLALCPAAAVLFLAPGVLWSCGGADTAGGDGNTQDDAANNPDSGITLSGANVVIELSKQSNLSSVGGAIRVQVTGFNGDDAFVVVHTAQDTYKAMTAICTHQRGNLELPTDGSGVVTCDRHQSKFSIADASFAENTRAPFGNGEWDDLIPFQATYDSAAGTLTLTATA